MLDSYFWEFITSTGKRQGTMYVTPDTARRILDVAGPQRRILKGQIARYAERMRKGKWADDAGGDILFDIDGRSRGGQHRLLAQLEAGVDISYKVRWDQTEAEIAADGEGGTPWSAADIAGGDLPHAAIRQAITGLLLITDRNDGLIASGTGWTPGRQDVADFVNDKRVVRASEVASAIRSHVPGLLASSIGALYALAVNTGKGDPHSFFTQLHTGAGLTLGDPVLTLREMLNGKLFEDLRQKKWQTLYVGTRAWNHYVNGERVVKLQRYQPPVTGPIRPIGWKPFFPSK
jgi:hypothetical protein